LEVNINCYRLKLIKIWRNLSGWNWPSNNKIFTFLESARNLQSEKVPYRYIGQFQFLTFIWTFSIFKASWLSTNLIDFTSHHSFLRVRRDLLLQDCKKTYPIYTVLINPDNLPAYYTLLKLYYLLKKKAFLTRTFRQYSLIQYSFQVYLLLQKKTYWCVYTYCTVGNL
jgi:hypothetical protein